MVNLVTEFRVSIFAQFLPRAPDGAVLDRGVDAFVTLALETKAFCVFSCLFGVGLAIQFERLSRRGPPLRWLVRRLLALLAFGAVHLFLIWNGDILTEYALAGFVALPFLFAPSWAVLAGSSAFLGLYFALPSLSLPVAWPGAASVASYVEEANRIYPSCRLLDCIALSIRELDALLPLHVYVFPRTVALFLFGTFVWRTGVLVHARAHRGLLIGTACCGLALGAAPNVGAWQLAWPLSGMAPILLAVGYGAGVICLVELTWLRGPLAALAPLGRAAFSNYLLQSLIFSWIFFGYGLGQFARLAPAETALLGVAVYALQVAASAWWLRRYRFGPMEWLWRSWMYGEPQPMRLGRESG
jgi:uncharacterized protein